MEAKVESFEVTIVGKRPLLMHHIPPDALTSRGRGVRPSQEEDARAALYQDEEGTVCVPALNIKASIREAAKQFKMPGRGKVSYRDAIRSGIIIEPDMVPILCDDDPPWEIDTRPVVVQRARVMRSRPKFNGWSLEFSIAVVDPVINVATLREIVEAAGRFTGLCDFRPEFGLFTIERWEKV